MTSATPLKSVVLNTTEKPTANWTYLTLAEGTPDGHEAEKNPRVGRKVVSMPRLGGLHHRYDLAA
jgi:hypothetical protein